MCKDHVDRSKQNVKTISKIEETEYWNKLLLENNILTIEIIGNFDQYCYVTQTCQKQKQHTSHKS